MPAAWVVGLARGEPRTDERSERNQPPRKPHSLRPRLSKTRLASYSVFRQPEQERCASRLIECLLDRIELLHPLAVKDLARIDDALGIDGDHVQAEELAAVL